MPSRSLRSLLLFLPALGLLCASPARPIDADSAATVGAALERREHLERLGVPAWHALGQRGRGLKVAVLDSGFQGYRQHLGKSLPAKVVVRSFRDDGDLEARDSQHGILCGEVIHAIAPDAELLFANWEPSHPQRFIDAVRWAVAQGARIVSCSIIMPTWSDGEGGGPVHAALKRALGDHVLFFACAGNTADRHWSGIFRDNGRGWHLWEESIDNALVPWGDGQVSVEMCAAQDAPLEVCVYDATFGRDVQRCRLHVGEHRTAVVRFRPTSGHRYTLRVRAVSRMERQGFHLFVLGGSLRQPRVRGSIPFPGDGLEVITVGAVEKDGQRATYSSCGPNSARLKPDVVALVPFASTFRQRPFTGTSAATPQAAGLAALLWGRQADWTPEEVWKALRSSARDLGPKGHDWETGHGMIHLP